MAERPRYTPAMTMHGPPDEQAIFAIERPSPKLFTYYCLSSLVR